MLLTAEEILNLISVNKDRELGAWDREYMTGMIPHIMESCASMKFPKPALNAMFDAIESQIPESLQEKTNITVHFTIQGMAMQQYISPIHKKYSIGYTNNGIDEKVLWIFRPEHVKVGYIKDLTYQAERNHSLRDERSHEFGTCDEYFNIVALHTHEYDLNANSEASTVHIAILIPVGDKMLREVSQLHHQQMMHNKSQQEILKGVERFEKKLGRKKDIKFSKPKVRRCRR